MLLDDYNYNLPEELIAQSPLEKRDSSRLMVIDRGSKTIEHTFFSELPGYLEKGDLIVANNTRVIPARLYAKKQTGGSVEIFLLNPFNMNGSGHQVWECLVKSHKKIKPQTRLSLSKELHADLIENSGEGIWKVCFNCNGDFFNKIKQTGKTPLPPYIKRQGQDKGVEEKDRLCYQTIYAEHDGAVAAPTAGLHFTPEIFEILNQKGVETSFITLHIGYGTFQPIRQTRVEKHRMHQEYYSITEKTAEKINSTIKKGNNVIAVGTTATRTIETVSRCSGRLFPAEGYTDLFIKPGFCFKATNSMITNFHLPKSSLLLLVAAFAGRDFILRAYREAIEKRYRFYSYGDAMLIV